MPPRARYQDPKNLQVCAGLALRELRERLGLTQEAATAKLAKLRDHPTKQATISQTEAGRMVITVELLASWGLMLGCEASYILATAERIAEEKAKNKYKWRPPHV